MMFIFVRFLFRHMQNNDDQHSAALAGDIAGKTIFSILLSISFSHLLNDTIQSLIPSIYPVVKNSFHLNFSQIGIITLIFQLTASMFQPLIGLYTDRKPQPYSLAIGMVFTLSGLILLSQANNYTMLLISVAVIGTGSSVFHPEASKVAYMASGGRRGLAQSIFPGWWQPGGITWAYTCCFDHRSLWAVEYPLVFNTCTDCNYCAFKCWKMVYSSYEQDEEKGCCNNKRTWFVGSKSRLVSGYSADPYFFKILLYGIHHQLLYFLPDT